jgi:hypothetical protein
MIRDNTMTVYKAIAQDGSAFFLSACNDQQAKALASDRSRLPIVTVLPLNHDRH